MADLSKIYLFRMTHIENIPHILQYGITHINSKNKNPSYKTIGDTSLISTRELFSLPDKTVLGDYIPFYFGPRMPMLYVMQKGYNGVVATNPEDIVYCISSIQKITDYNLKYLFTDGHAVDSYSSYFDSNDIVNIKTIVDFQAVKATYWRDDSDLDLKRRKEAEFLLSQDLPPGAIIGYYVYNDTTKKQLLSYGIDSNKIQVKPDYYF